MREGKDILSANIQGMKKQTPYERRELKANYRGGTPVAGMIGGNR